MTTAHPAPPPPWGPQQVAPQVPSAAPCVVRRTVWWPWLPLLVVSVVGWCACLWWALQAWSWIWFDAVVALVVLLSLALLIAGNQLVQTLVVAPFGVGSLRPLGVRALVPWPEVVQLQVLPDGRAVGAAAGGPALTVNGGRTLRASLGRRVRAFRLEPAQATDVLAAAEWFALHRDVGHRGRDGAVPPFASLRIQLYPGRPARLAVRTALVGLMLVLVGFVASAVGGGPTLVGTSVVLGLMCLVCALGVRLTGALWLEIDVRSVRLVQRTLSGSRAFAWQEVYGLMVADLPTRAPRWASDQVPMATQLRLVRRLGDVESVLMRQVPPQSAQLVADVLHAHRPDLI